MAERTMDEVRSAMGFTGRLDVPAPPAERTSR
jgi:hypothetical protein